MTGFGIKQLREFFRTPVRLGRWSLPWPVAVLAFGLTYGLAARLGLLLATAHGNVSPVWPATGVALGGLLLGSQRLWPGIALGAFAVNAFTPIGFLAAAAIAVGNTLEGALGAALIRAWTNRFSRLGQLAEPLAIVGAALVAPLASASIGVGSLALSGTVPFSMFSQLWQTWWVGDSLGALVVTPVILLAAGGTGTSAGWNRALVLKAVALAVIVAGVCGLVFSLATGAEWLFLVFPVLLIAVAWFDSAGVRLTALLISSISIVAAYLGSSPLPGHSLNHSLLNLQFFMASVAMAALVLPAFRSAGRLLYPGIVLLVGWGVSGWMFASLYQERLRADETHFKNLTASAERAIAQRMQTYEDALRGAAGLFAATESMARAEWRAYASALRLGERYPGIHGVGAVFAVAESEAERFVAATRADGAPDFTIHAVPDAPQPPAGPNGREHFVITYIEPLENNRSALGLDLASEVRRRTAAAEARDSGQPRITERISLVQDSQTRPAFLMFVPMYHTGAPRETVAERRQAFRGWTYAPFITELYVRSVMGEQHGEAHLHFFDGHSTDPTNLLYTSTGEKMAGDFDQVSHLELSGHRFTLGWSRGPQFVSSDNTAAVLAGSSSALVSLLLAGLVVSLHSLGRRANAIATARTLELQNANARLEQHIAERQRMEAELRASEERSKAALDATSDGLWDWNVATGEVYFSPRLIEVLGYDAAAVRGHVDTWIAWLHPDDLPGAMAAVKEHFEGRTTNYEHVHRLRKKSGDWMWNLDRGQIVLRDAQGRPLRMIGTHTDISVRKRAEEETHRLAAVLEATSDCVGIADTHGNVIYINRAMRRTVGIPDDASLVGLVIPDFHPEKWTRYLREEGLPAAARDGFWEGETALQRRDGTEVPASQVIVAHKDAAGNVTCYSTIMRDITERKRVEEELRRAKESAEANNRAKSEFLAIMSHEIRTPMNGVIGFTDMLLDSELTHDQREWVRTIQNSGQGLLAVINDILDFSKIEAGKLTLEQIPFEPLVAFREAHALLAPKAAAKHIELRLETPPSLPEWVLGDPGRLRQIILNLASNAIKFTALGTVRVEVDWQARSAALGILKVAVHDTGIGIPPEKQALLFEKFTQADSSTTRKFGGTGLGLAICKRIVELQGGNIGMSSEPGKGSTFWFELPLEVATEPTEEVSSATPTLASPAPQSADSAFRPPEQTRSATLASEAGPSARPLRVLLAEDVIVNQTLAVGLLTKLGCTVELAANGHEAVARATENRYDLIFMDCQMPELDGFDAAREIRRHEAASRDASGSSVTAPSRRVPIVAVTANAMQGDRDLCLAAGMDDYISKPFRADDLKRAVERWARPSEPVAP